MSSVLRPVGDKPPNIYWRRRVVVIVVLVVFLALLIWGIRAVLGVMAGDEQAAVTPSPSPSASTLATASGTQSPSGSGTQSASGSAGECGDDALKVSATSSSREVAAGAAIKVGMLIENVSDSACSFDAGSANLSLKVTSGNDQIWSSDDCQGAGENAPTVVQPGGQLTSEVAWNGVRSAEGCPTGLAKLKAGTYQLRASVGDITSGALTITLT